jgi:23S rRNA-/tRNA-specific pseudouridylate synthase
VHVNGVVADRPTPRFAPASGLSPRAGYRRSSAAEALPLPIVHDDHDVVVVMPAGMVVHPAAVTRRARS